MDLRKFPFDQQQCKTVLESWMYNGSDLKLHWEARSPVTMGPDQHLTEYELMSTFTNETMINADLSDLRHGAFAGNYSSLSFTVTLKRQMGFYLLDYFLPSMMIVAISWVSFWLQADQTGKSGIARFLYYKLQSFHFHWFRPNSTSNYAGHNDYVDIHHLSFGSRQNFAESQLHQSLGNLVHGMHGLHLWVTCGVCFRQHDLEAKEERGIEEGELRIHDWWFRFSHPNSLCANHFKYKSIESVSFDALETSTDSILQKKSLKGTSGLHSNFIMDKSW